MRKWQFGKAEGSARFDSANVPRWATNPNYEKINLHFGQCRASRSLRAKDRRRCSGEFAGAGGEENRAQHHGRESAGNGKEGDNGRESAGNDGEERNDDYDDVEPEPVVSAAFQFAKSSRGSSAGRLLLYEAKTGAATKRRDSSAARAQTL